MKHMEILRICYGLVCGYHPLLSNEELKVEALKKKMKMIRWKVVKVGNCHRSSLPLYNQRHMLSLYNVVSFFLCSFFTVNILFLW
ncbi:hypothetical protein QL285_030132 [Trifolium repens]|nr:hypothetical protein QL285_030132 [Trifolium repens]